MRRLAPLTLAAASAAALSLAACGQATPDETIPPDAGVQDPTEGGAPEPDQGEDLLGDVPTPEPGQCVDLPEASDGRYLVGDAGSAVVTVEGGRLVVGEVAPLEGWTYEVTEAEADEVEIEFRGDGRELDLEIELDDMVLQVQVCEDDD
ncbi:hypothetical protein [Cellulomonas bogoriensis]|uniref:Lipoprotein n=1 Tax=Cellulomonas bogoriensis 69B4 = DSM 16987 TaxID=1386082 RepID=A0A0A0BXZ6_9CELL|nr:hypothetical protein [Cellulomonas bogoriensis]KGM13233.1 hypothetical protein N869_15470 [Cellulomonas bogoriensis 69B4 = DSM 16987]